MKAPQQQRAYHQQVLKEVTQMLRVGGKIVEEEIKPLKPTDHEWAAQKVKALVKA